MRRAHLRPLAWQAPPPMPMPLMPPRPRHLASLGALSALLFAEPLAALAWKGRPRSLAQLGAQLAWQPPLAPQPAPQPQPPQTLALTVVVAFVLEARWACLAPRFVASGSLGGWPRA
jgi:hypothetical protein